MSEPTPGAVADARVEAGMRAQLQARAQLLAEGDQGIGWKVGFNAPAAQERLGIDRALTGFLVRSRVLATGSTHALDGASVVAEPEIAVELARDVAAGTEPGEALAAVRALLPAIELTELPDLSLPLEDILAGDIFHRAVCFGGAVETHAPGAGRLLVDGEEWASFDAAATSGHLGAMVALCADRLAAAGETLRAGDRVITGVLAKPPVVSAGAGLRLELEALGTVELGFS